MPTSWAPKANTKLQTLAEHLKMDFRSVDIDDTDWLDAMPDVMDKQPFAQHLNSVPFLMVSVWCVPPVSRPFCPARGPTSVTTDILK